MASRRLSRLHEHPDLSAHHSGRRHAVDRQLRVPDSDLRPGYSGAIPDAGVNRILLPSELKMNPGRVADLNAKYPQAGSMAVSESPPAPRTCALPQVSNCRSAAGGSGPVPRLWAYNPQIVRQFLQPPIVADRSMFPNNQTFLQAITASARAIHF